jgi:uncharacterized membrane protein
LIHPFLNTAFIEFAPMVRFFKLVQTLLPTAVFSRMTYWGRVGRSLLSISLVILLAGTLFLSFADSALAARGGRIGGGSFRAPRPSFSAPRSRTYAPRGGGFGGGIGFPFLIPFYGFGFGGGLLSLFILLTVIGFLAQTFRQVMGGDNESESGSSNPKVSVLKLQVGLLAGAKSLQTDLARIAMTSDTSTNDGLAGILQETSLALLRHPEYWAYGDSSSEQLRLNAAESRFNALTLQERSKFSAEVVSNVQGQLQSSHAAQTASNAIAQATPTTLAEARKNEYIVVTLLIGMQGNLQLPSIQGVDELRQAIRQAGAVSASQLLAAEILWTPEGENDVLTADDLVAQYPNLRLV